jgi:tetratricopeptide (TPR) repeat protein
VLYQIVTQAVTSVLHNAAPLKFSDWIERLFMLSHMLKSVVAAAFVLSATLALALPTPKDIEAAVAAGQYTQAETMLREVLHDKPQSAKAHYELGQVLAHEHRYKDAQAEVLKAKELDPALKFAASPDKFNTVFAKVNELAVAPSSSVVMEPSVVPGTHVAANASPEPGTNGGGSPLTYVWLAIAGLVVLGLWLRRSAANAANQVDTATSMGTAPAQRGFGAQFTPSAAPAGYAPQGYAQSNSGGSTMAGAVVGGLAGVAAGYALSKALEGEHHTSVPASSGASPVTDNGGYVPFDTPAQPDLGSFDAGSGSDWDGADSGGGSDDTW